MPFKELDNSWVFTTPHGLVVDKVNQARADAIRERFRRIENAGKPRHCAMCGQPGKLTREHVPARAAGNDKPGAVYSISQELSKKADDLVYHKKFGYADGIKVKTLCRRCNNGTGADYVPAYVSFARAMEPLARPDQHQRYVSASAFVHPLRVAKQALVSIIATCQPGLTEVYQGLRKLLMEKERFGAVPGVHLYAFLAANNGAAYSTGLSARLDTASGRNGIYAEMACWPLGWVLALEDEKLHGFFDATSWLDYSYDDKKLVTPSIPCSLIGMPA